MIRMSSNIIPNKGNLQSDTDLLSFESRRKSRFIMKGFVCFIVLKRINGKHLLYRLYAVLRRVKLLRTQIDTFPIIL